MKYNLNRERAPKKAYKQDNTNNFVFPFTINNSSK